MSPRTRRLLIRVALILFVALPWGVGAWSFGIVTGLHLGLSDMDATIVGMCVPFTGVLVVTYIAGRRNGGSA